MKQLQIWPMLLLLTVPPTTVKAASTKEQRTHGVEVFKDSGCGHCHTIGAVGGTKGPNLSAVGRRLEADQMRKQITDGGKQMPAFGDVLQAEELDDLIVYLRSLRGKKK
jgi:mono/diheme cytochrome c family protein